ncbi:MAG: M56 family metallopeptidase [Oscillospiraceae bacterium]|nr:M56 family metallopeptidase [Oscillospiraceae bacterium]
MNITFLDLFNASICASWLVLVVVVLRFLLRKAPKAIHCALWALVAIRLLCPISIESPVSLVPSTETLSMEYHLEQSIYTSQQTVLDIVENPIYPEDVNVFIEAPISRISVWDIEWSVIWLIGVGMMAAYVLISWLRLQKKVAASIPIAKDIRLCDHIESPFILGVFNPLIYLPSDMEQAALDHVLAHEKAHLARKDHWWKPLGFLLLTIHWFNPIMWLAYILLCRDIELACDEKVIRDLNAEQKKAYSTALLDCSVSRPMIAACPLAFGEVGVKDRVKTILNYKKPAFWIVVLAIILCGVVAVCFLTDPVSLTVHDILESDDYTILAQCDQYVDLIIPLDVLNQIKSSEDGCEFHEKEVVVFESDTSTIWLRSTQYANEGAERMYFEFDISYELPKVGTILLPYWINEESGYRTDFRIASNPSFEDTYTYDDSGLDVRGTGPDNRFTVYVDTAVAMQPYFHYMTIGVCMNQLTYAKVGLEPELNRGVFSSAVPQDRSFQASGNEVYRIGWDSVRREVFLDPYGAFRQFIQDYSAAIKHIELTNSLNPLTPLSYHEHLRLGWQTTSPDAQLTNHCAAVSEFLDVYDNSMIPANEYESACNGTYQAGDLLAQHAMISSGFGRGDRIFHLFEYSLSVYDLMGGEVFTSNHIIINHPTRDEVFGTMQYKMVVWNETGTEMTEVTKDFIPDDANIELWQFYTDGMAEYPEYTLFFFDGELKWFAENYGDSYARIWEVTIPMDEDEKLPSGTYVSAEKVFWAWHSSLYVEGITMEVNNNAISLAFQGIDVGGASIYPLEADWQTECLIIEKRREILAELSNLEPAFALSDLSDCRFLVIDPTHFLVEKDGALYVVSWNHSNVHLEMIDYIFHVVPETESTRIPLGDGITEDGSTVAEIVP